VNIAISAESFDLNLMLSTLTLIGSDSRPVTRLDGVWPDAGDAETVVVTAARVRMTSSAVKK
jgi:hypothetical protein